MGDPWGRPTQKREPLLQGLEGKKTNVHPCSEQPAHTQREQKGALPSTPTPRALHTQLMGSGEGRGQPIVLDHRAAPLGVTHGAHVGHAQGVTGGGSTQVLPGRGEAEAGRS